MKRDNSKIQPMKTIRSILFSAPLLFLPLFFACTSVLYIAPKQADCVEGAGKPCYLIRTSPEGNWVLHDREITGLNYEEGFTYTIKVKKTNAKEREQSGTDAEYIVLSVVEKKDATEAIVVHDLMNKEWILEQMKINGQNITPGDQPPTMTFTDDGKIAGFAGCNRYFGGYAVDGRTITISGIGATKMFCQDSMDIEGNFLKGLSLPLRALFSESKLVLHADQGVELIFRYK